MISLRFAIIDQVRTKVTAIRFINDQVPDKVSQQKRIAGRE